MMRIIERCEVRWVVGGEVRSASFPDRESAGHYASGLALRGLDCEVVRVDLRAPSMQSPRPPCVESRGGRFGAVAL